MRLCRSLRPTLWGGQLPRAFPPPTPPPSLLIHSFSTINLRPHLDIRPLATDPSVLSSMRHNLTSRHLRVDVDSVISLFHRCNQLQFHVENLRHLRNKSTAAIASAPTPTARDSLIAEAQRMKADLARDEAMLEQLKEELDGEALKLPNRLHPSTPIGPEGAGRITAVVGSPPSFSFPPADHLSLCHQHDLVDFPAAAITTGSRFYFLKHELALLELALIQFSMQHLVKRGFTPIIPPDLVQRDFVYATGFQPRDDKETQVYQVDGGLSLIGTAEIPLAAYYANHQFPSTGPPMPPAWPILHCGHSHCFRTEAGGHGKETKGLYRVHQFSKVEMFALCPPALCDSTFDLLIGEQRRMLEELGLFYRVVEIPSGDLGAAASRKVDMEVWMPGRNKWGEVSSASDCEEYQSRRLNVRYKEGGEKGKWRFVHTLNGSACAVPRLIIGIMEQFQREDGTVAVPKVLQPFMMGIDTIPHPLVKRVHEVREYNTA